MKKEVYKPNPEDTSDIILPHELMELGEKLAENVHEVWAQARLKEGWTYGEQRDDMKKTHPCLISYEELPETEKQYDRMTSMESLKLILKLGFKITN